MALDKALKPEPYLELGNPTEGGLRVPSAKASRVSFYGPRGVFYDGEVLVVADTGNHRVLIWHGLPEEDHAPADIVLGQEDFSSDSPNAGGNPEKGMYMPCGVCVREGRLFVADAWNHRILVWDKIPDGLSKKPDHVIGQPDLLCTEPSTGSNTSPYRFFWCYGVGFVKDYLFVCDTGNRRVLGWKGIPDYGQKPDILLGQEDLYSCVENRNGSIDYNTYLWPHSISSDDKSTFIADAGNHRVLGFKDMPDDSRIPDVLLGQKDFKTAEESPFMKQSNRTLRFPYGVSVGSGMLAVADTANNRVLLWQKVPEEGIYLGADYVLGQKSFEENGENRWEEVRKDTLCWCYDVHIHEDLIFVADTGNNRVTIWRLGE